MKPTLDDTEKGVLFVKLTTAINNCLKKAISKLLEQGAPIINPLVPEDYTAVHYAAAACCPQKILASLLEEVTDLSRLYNHPKGPPWELSKHCQNEKAIHSFFKHFNITTTTATTTTTKATTLEALRSSLRTIISTTDNRTVRATIASQPSFSVRIGISAAIGISNGLVHAFFKRAKDRYPDSQKKRLACTAGQILMSSLLNVGLVVPFSHPTRLGVDTDLNSALVYGGMTLGWETLIAGMDSFAGKKKWLQNSLSYCFILIPLCLLFLSADDDKDTFSDKCFALLANLLASALTYEVTRWIAHRFVGQADPSNTLGSDGNSPAEPLYLPTEDSPNYENTRARADVLLHRQSSLEKEGYLMPKPLEPIYVEIDESAPIYDDVSIMASS